MEGLIHKVVEVWALGSLKPAIEVRITWSIHAIFGDFVLSHQV
jgi:hypothetical protein